MDPGSFVWVYPSTDDTLNKACTTLSEICPCHYSRHFNYLEEFFLKLGTSYTVPSFPIHHDVRIAQPDTLYLNNLRKTLLPLLDLLPSLFSGLSYLFDPAETLRPLFYQVYNQEKNSFLFLLRLDLSARLQEVEVLQKGSNDFTPAYRSNRLYLESDILPLEKHEIDSTGKRIFYMKRLISQTWIGEQGRGYVVQGIWIDRDLSKFFSKLLLPPGIRIYPYYPYNSRHTTLCLSPLFPEANRRGQYIPLADRAIRFLTPHLPAIETVLKQNEFSENLELFQRIKKEVPGEWYRDWERLRVRTYLNELDMKEYQIEEIP